MATARTENNEWWNEPHVVPLKSGELYSTIIYIGGKIFSSTLRHFPPPSITFHHLLLGWARVAPWVWVPYYGITIPLPSPAFLESHVAAKDCTLLTNAMMTIKKCLWVPYYSKVHSVGMVLLTLQKRTTGLLCRSEGLQTQWWQHNNMTIKCLWVPYWRQGKITGVKQWMDFHLFLRG